MAQSLVSFDLLNLLIATAVSSVASEPIAVACKPFDAWLLTLSDDFQIPTAGMLGTAYVCVQRVNFP